MLRPFHLAVPVPDLDAARAFYVGVLGCTEGRSAAGWVDFDLFGHQLVCHLDTRAPETSAPLGSRVDGHDVPVPHFGVVLALDEWEALISRLETAGVTWRVPPHVRFAGLPGEQATAFLDDPAGHAIELKGFRDLSRLFALQPARAEPVPGEGEA